MVAGDPSQPTDTYGMLCRDPGNGDMGKCRDDKMISPRVSLI